MAVVGHQKGRDTKQKIYRNFGMPKPEGYRKALRVMQLAEKFRRPIVTFVDTPGAYPGPRRRGARARRRPSPTTCARWPRLPHADRGERHRRGRQRRRARHRRRRPREHARALGLLGDLARGLRVHPLARRRAGRGGGHGHEDHRPRPRAASASSTRSSPSRREARTATGTRCSASFDAVLDRQLPRAVRAAPGRARRRRATTKFRAMGRLGREFVTAVTAPQA